MKQCLKLKHKGMTLVEAIIGTVLLVICALMMMTGFRVSFMLVREAEQKKIQSSRAAEIVEIGNYPTGNVSNIASDNSKIEEKINKTTITLYKTNPNGTFGESVATVDGAYYIVSNNSNELDKTKIKVKYTVFTPGVFYTNSIK